MALASPQLLSHGCSGVRHKHYDPHDYVEEKRSARRMFRLSSPWYGRSNVLADRLDALYRGKTFADLKVRRSGLELLITAADLTNGAPFEFTREQFTLICGDLGRVPLSFAVAASSAVPLVLTPMTLRNFAGQCSAPPPGGAAASADANYRARLVRTSAESYRNADEAGREALGRSAEFQKLRPQFDWRTGGTRGDESGWSVAHVRDHRSAGSYVSN